MLLFVLIAVAPAPVDKTLQFGQVAIHLRQSVDARGQVSCDIETATPGQLPRKRSAEFQASRAFDGCFTLPSAQTARGFFMVREMMRDAPRTLLIATSGAVLDLDDMLVRGGRWDLVQAD